MPCNGILREMIYVPGDLFSVNHLTAQNVPNLFARNERVICLFDTEFGPMAQILVGATIVGSIETVVRYRHPAARRHYQTLDLACWRQRRLRRPAERPGDGPLQAGLHGDQPVCPGQVKLVDSCKACR
jgi:phosphatidylserine decarboxylase